MTLRALITILLIALLGGALVACGSDDDRPPVRGGGTTSGGTSSGGNGANNQDDPNNQDAPNNQDDPNDQDDPQSCDLQPSQLHVDERFPCCFSDDDCRASDSPFADQLICFRASCTEGGEGTCRLPLEPGECWKDSHCPEDQVCPYEDLADLFQCTENILEQPEFCVPG